MGSTPGKTFGAKHGSKSPQDIDAAVRQALVREAPDGQIACAAAFKLAAELVKPPAEIGQAADLLNIRLVRCQLGLFGYAPEKKIVTAASASNPELEQAIRGRLENGRLACRQAWDLAEGFRLSRMAVSETCEAMGIKVKPCQLGAF